MCCQDGAAGRARLDKTHRKGCGRVDGDLVPPGGHQETGTVEAVMGEALAHLNQVTRHQRLDVGVGTGRALALVLTNLRTDFAGKGDGKIG